MISALSYERAAPVKGASARENLSKGLKSRAGDRLHEIALFALVAVAMFYIAAAGDWLIF